MAKLGGRVLGNPHKGGVWRETAVGDLLSDPVVLAFWITGRCLLEVFQSHFLLAPNSPLIYYTFVQPVLGFQSLSM